MVLLFAEWDWRRLLRAGAVALAVAAAIFVVAAIAFGDPFGFISGQSDRGLQRGAAATAPWLVDQIFSGAAPHTEVHSAPGR